MLPAKEVVMGIPRRRIGFSRIMRKTAWRREDFETLKRNLGVQGQAL
jgi:hypothetical protein